MSFNVGENVGPYRIIEQLGQGGMATVYKAYHASLDRYVALKVLHPAFHQDQTFTMRFQREARVVARLEHTNIVPVYDYAEHEGRPYLVMKYIEGDTLKARLNQGALNSEEIERVVTSVGYALAYAHRQGILHRDIKPSNVMIAVDGTMYLTDFGLARIAEAGESTMSSDSIMGTPQYISPEQAMGKKDLDAGTDIYSFGVMLYEMVVGRVPFTADTPFSIIHDHIYTPLPLPMTVNANVPEPVQRVLLKALAKDRADRYLTIEELIKAFKDAWIEAGVPMQGTAIMMRATTAKIPSAPVLQAKQEEEPAAAPVQRKTAPQWMWFAIGALVMLLFFTALIALRNNRGAQKQREEIPTAAILIPPTIIPATRIPPPTQPLPPAPANTSPEIQAAIDEVMKAPNNPDLHLNLSLLFWEAGQYPPALDEMRRVMEFADPNIPDFYIKAASEYKKREAWIPAATMYMRLTPIYRAQGGGMPPDLQQNLREAVYKAASPNVPVAFDMQFDRLDNFNTPIADIARARHALYNNNLDAAKRQMEKAKAQAPDLIELSLLEAEIALKEGNPQTAREIFSSVASNPTAPEWTRALAEEYLKTLP